MEINIRLYKKEDIPHIVNLLNEVFKKQQYFDLTRDVNWWNWKYETNVFGKSIIVVAEDNSKIIGARCLWPWEFCCRGEIIKAYQPVDTVVHPDYQGQGIFKKMNIYAVDFAIKDDAKLLYNFSNKNSIHGNLKLGWHFVSKLEWWIKIKKPLNLLKSKKNDEKKKVFDPITPLDEKDLLYIKDSRTYSELLKTKKDRDFLEWRYLKNPFFKYGIVKIDKFVCVYIITGNSKSKTMTVVDFIGEKSSCFPLIKKINKIGKECNVDFITFLNDNTTMNKGLNKYGYIKIKEKNLVALPLNISLENKVLNYKNWAIFGGLHDSL